MTNSKSPKLSKSSLEQFQFEVASELGISDKLKNSSLSTSSSKSSQSSK